ncbi:MAG: MoaD/ThiS family protein [Microbacterium sp.]
MITVRYFAAAEEAAGRPEESREERTLDALRAAVVADHPALGAILPRCSVLVDGSRHDADVSLAQVRTIDILPPFAGG